jgi:hypothetical protein
LLEHRYRKMRRLALRSSRMGGRGYISVFDDPALKYALLQIEGKGILTFCAGRGRKKVAPCFAFE